MLSSKTFSAVPPGETLKEQLLNRGMTQNELAVRMNVSPESLSELIQGQTGLTEKMAFRLETVLGIPSQFWLHLERNYRETIALVNEENNRKDGLPLLPDFSISVDG